MEYSLQKSTWEVIQETVLSDHRIKAIRLRNYVHVWTRTESGEVLRKDDQPERIIKRDQLRQKTNPEELRKSLVGFGEEAKYWNVSLSSKVEVRRRGIGFLPGKLGTKTRHLALLDMDLPVSEENLSIIKQRTAEMLVKPYGHFFIAESGNSYHLVGTKPLSHRQMIRAYGTSLLLDVNKHVASDGIRKHLVDSLYVGHCLERNGTGHLRLTGSAKRPVPRVVGYI